MAAINFKYKEYGDADDFASYTSSMQNEYPLDKLLYAPYAFEKWDPDRIMEYLSFLVPQNSIVVVCSKAQEIDDSWVKEKWHGGTYKEEPLTPNYIEKYDDEETSLNLRLPSPNTFIPDELSLVKPPVESPTDLKEAPDREIESNVDLWTKIDTSFRVPRASIVIFLKSSEVYNAPGNIVSTRMFARLVGDSLNEYAYDATTVGLETSFSTCNSFMAGWLGLWYLCNNAWSSDLHKWLLRQAGPVPKIIFVKY
ncbi:MAG: hypothetical protein AAF376_06645, partial [Pseudomonadota bacterium]